MRRWSLIGAALLFAPTTDFAYEWKTHNGTTYDARQALVKVAAADPELKKFVDEFLSDAKYGVTDLDTRAGDLYEKASLDEEFAEGTGAASADRRLAAARRPALGSRSTAIVANRPSC